MAKEIERKFLVKGDQWKGQSKPLHTRQGYMNTGGESTVRVRIQGEKAFLTIKGKTEGISRSEFEYGIPVEDAREMLATLCRKPYIEKNRYKVMYAGMEWEVDEFKKDNQGLVLAEIELESEDQQVELPPWVGEEVSHDFRYRNVNLMLHPYSQWRKPQS